MKELINIQAALKAPKSQRNTFGKYNYRSCEDILEAVKPLLKAENCFLVISDKIINVGNRNYVEATATLHLPENKQITVTGCACESETKKGMDSAQITGSASSYARKYALNGLFAIDDTKDADATNTHGQQQAPLPKPQMLQQAPVITADQVKVLMTVGAGANVPDVKAIISKYGFASSKQISPDKFAGILAEVQALPKVK